MAPTPQLQTVILCGGYGTRMGSVTGTTPKPMVSVGGMPLLWHVMRCYADQGHRRFVLCLGYLGEVIRAWFAAHPQPGWEVILVDTGVDASTAGRLAAAAPWLDRDASFFLTYGDGVADVDLAGLLAHHREQGRLATVTALRPQSRFGVLDLDQGVVSRFREKPRLDQYVSGGFFVFEHRLLASLDPRRPLEDGTLAELAQRGELAAWRHGGFWLSVDTPRDLAEINAMYDKEDTPWLAASS